MPNRPIAVLIDNIESDYHIEILSGVVRGLRTSSHQALIVAGGWIATEQAPTARNFVYDLLAGAALDGVLVLAGSLSNFCGAQVLRDWLSRYRHVPVVCIGLDIEGWPSVSVDNGAGTYAAVSHLIEHHQRRRIACIRGPTQGVEAQARYEAYERALAAHGLALDPRLVWIGTSLGRDDGELGVREFFDERKLAIEAVDAIVCVNDDVALGALEALTRRGTLVPDQIGLVGFDDGPNARAANPPLTTVNQGVERQGFTAARALVDAIDQGQILESKQLDSQAVIRASCGCRIPYANDSRSLGAVARGVTRSFGLALIERRTAVLAQVARAASGRLGSQRGWEERLLNALVEEAEGSSSSFVYALESLTRHVIAAGGSADPCNDVLTQLRLQSLSIAPPDVELRARLEDSFQEARTMLANVALSVYRERDQASLWHVRHVAKACFETCATCDLKPVARALGEHLPALGIRACAVSRLVQRSEHERGVEIVASLDQGLGPAGVLAPDVSLGLDASLLHQSAVVVQPLEHARTPVGLAAFSWGAHNPILYEQLREILGGAVHSATRGLTA